MFVNEMKDSLYCIEFEYPPGMTPQSIPLANVSRKGNCLQVYFKKVPNTEQIQRIRAIIDSTENNPAKYLTDKHGGLKYRCFRKNQLTDNWEDA